ncbi:NADPH-dependent FMN reductase [Microvirga sp. CF3062]|uniref:NADPH-dependent FMN reductase n=1 Tax=Microvirga sp. CF3062 TaxID=3110182 RepID=UPI002E78653C|nr:NADPH-dependent FMN reductase [Microvirga sp. CF3062]MEE1656925.1 NADPH-dependent FMN reductase [Microvirga sp. CF3062]
MQILAISGSLRAASSNSRVICALREVAEWNVEVLIYEGLDKLPHFNPDLDGDEPPQEVARLRQLVGTASALVIASPEYAHGIPGVLKNALDWLVASSEFLDMPIALINTSPRATHAQAQLIEVLTTMAGHVQPQASVTLDRLGELGTIDPAEDPESARMLRSVLIELARVCREESVGR